MVYKIQRTGSAARTVRNLNPIVCQLESNESNSWKHFLPPRWKDSNISSDKSLVDMDPNLTLAHLTHNTSMILLHLPIAVPPVEWTNLLQLPSSSSAATCGLAASEISHIAGKFLQHTQIPFVNPQFSFCLLVAAKALLSTYSLLCYQRSELTLTFSTGSNI